MSSVIRCGDRDGYMSIACGQLARWRHGGCYFCSIHRMVTIQQLVRQQMQHPEIRAAGVVFRTVFSTVRSWFQRYP